MQHQDNEYDHILDDPEDIVEWVRSFDSDDMIYSRHFETVLEKREHVKKDELLELLFDSDDLIDANYNPDGGDPSYILVFDRSNKYYMKVVVSEFEGDLSCVTAYLANKTASKLDNLLKR